MSDKSKIEWTDATWNPIRGCSRVSEGCRNCYAEKVAARFSGHDSKGKALPYEGLTRDGKWNGTIRVVEDALLQPLKWKAPRRIFVNSMSDLFHANVTDETIDRIFAVMALCPQHTFQILTKRPERMAEYFSALTRVECASIGGMGGNIEYRFRRQIIQMRCNELLHAGPKGQRIENAYEIGHEVGTGARWPLPNVWLGVSVENQATADERIPHLLRTPDGDPVAFPSCMVTRVGKKAAGRVLDGRTWDEFPERKAVEA